MLLLYLVVFFSDKLKRLSELLLIERAVCILCLFDCGSQFNLTFATWTTDWLGARGNVIHLCHHYILIFAHVIIRFLGILVRH